MADAIQERYAGIMAATLGSLRTARRAQVRWIRGDDAGRDGSAYLLCVAIGPALTTVDGEPDREVFGSIYWSDGQYSQPTPVLAERRAALLRDIGLTA